VSWALRKSKKVWHLSALGAALPQLVGDVVGDVARPSFVGVACDDPNGIVALALNLRTQSPLRRSRGHKPNNSVLCEPGR
jgi:hypothetical protein